MRLRAQALFSLCCADLARDGHSVAHVRTLIERGGPVLAPLQLWAGRVAEGSPTEVMAAAEALARALEGERLELGGETWTRVRCTAFLMAHRRQLELATRLLTLCRSVHPDDPVAARMLTDLAAGEAPRRSPLDPATFVRATSG